jgi:hypothetical protein
MDYMELRNQQGIFSNTPNVVEWLNGIGRCDLCAYRQNHMVRVSSPKIGTVLK